MLQGTVLNVFKNTDSVSYSIRFVYRTFCCEALTILLSLAFVPSLVLLVHIYWPDYPKDWTSNHDIRNDIGVNQGDIGGGGDGNLKESVYDFLNAIGLANMTENFSWR